MLQRGIGRGGLGHVEPILTEEFAQRPTLRMILIDKQTSCHVDYSFQTHPQLAVLIAFRSPATMVVNASLTIFPQAHPQIKAK
jgi:hypothetical protein